MTDPGSCNSACADKTASPRSGMAPERRPSIRPAGKRTARCVLLAALIVAAALLVYAPVLRAGFIWDDDTFLARNPLIHASDGLWRFWFATKTADYYPLAFSLLWFEWRLWGPNAAGYHLVNVLLHAASAVLLWRVLLRLRLPGAWLAGLLFALHPAAVESVAWIEEHKSTLPIVFYLASLLAYLRFEDKTRADKHQSQLTIANCELPMGNYFLSLVLFLLALLAKTSVVMLPAVLLGCAWWRRGRVTRRDLLRALPFFALALTLGMVTVWYQYHNAIASDVVRTDGLAARAAGAGWAAWFYLYKALLPVNLCFVYPRWTTCASLLAFVPGLLFGGMLLLFARFRRSPSAVSSGPDGWGRPCLFALGYFLAALLPVLGFLNIYFMKYSLVADHWQYPALIGPIALMAGFLAWIIERRDAPALRGLAGSPRHACRARGEGGRRAAAMAAAGAAVLACGALTLRQSRIYHNEETLWRDTLAKNPKAWIAYGNLAVQLSQKSAASGADSARFLDEAERCCGEALRDLDQAAAPKPHYAEVYVIRGIVRAAAKRCGDALYDYDESIKLNPDRAEAYNNRGNLHAQFGHPADAVRDYDRAIALNAEFADAYNNRAVAQGRMGRWDLAVRDSNEAVRLKPDFAPNYYNRGKAFAALNHPEKAIADYSEAIRLNPAYAEAWHSRGIARGKTGRLEDAVADFSKAIELQPDYAEAYSDRAVARYCLKDYDQALADVKAAQKHGGAPDAAFLKALMQAVERRKTTP